MSAVLAPSTWQERELPFLAEALRQLEAGEVDEPGITAIAESAGLTEREALLAARALDGAYIAMRWMPGRGGRAPEHGMVRAVSPEGRRAVGTWPSAEAVLADLVAALREEADREADPKRRGALQRLADEIAGVAHDVAVNVLTKWLGG